MLPTAVGDFRGFVVLNPCKGVVVVGHVCTSVGVKDRYTLDQRRQGLSQDNCTHHPYLVEKNVVTVCDLFAR